ncbi:MAG: response regulator [Thiobacillus sp.]
MPQSEPLISVLVVEDDEAMRGEFVTMIDAAPGIALLAAAGSLSAARAALAAHGTPDVLIIDLGLPDGDGTALISELAATAPAASALVITVLGDERHVVSALEAGAKGYLLKDATPDEFVRSIRLVHEGGSPLSPKIARHLLKRFALPQTEACPPPLAQGDVRVEHLTAREAEILSLIAQGNTVAETAGALHLSPHTVVAHVKRIYDKLAVNNRVQAVNRARATGQIK